MRVLVLAGRIVRQFLRDHRTLALVIIVPSAVMGLLAYLVDEDKEPVTVGLVQQDEGFEAAPGLRLDLGNRLAEHLRRAPGILVVEADPEELARRLGDGAVAGGVLIPAGFSRELAGGSRPRFTLVLEGSVPSVNAQVQRAVQQAVQSFLSDLARATGTDVSPGPPVQLDLEFAHGGPDLATMDYFAPVFITAFVFFFVFLLTSVSFLRERSQGTMERLLASPISRLEVVVGYLLGFLVFAGVQALVILGFSLWVLGVSIAGSAWLVLLVELLLVVGAVNLGIYLSFFARTELQVVQFIPLVITPQVLLAGVIWPVETLTPVLRWLASVMPMTYAIRALRAVMVRGAEAPAVVGELGFLGGFAVAMVALAAWQLRREAL